MRYVFYPDVFWVTNFLLDMLVLFLVRYFKKCKSSILRLMVSSMAGATGSVLLFLTMKQYGMYQLLVHCILNPLMILIAFPVKNARSFWKDFITVYVMMFLFGGLMSWWVENLGHWRHFWIWALGAFAILMLVLHWLESRKMGQHSYELLLLTGDRSIMVTGFLDTGNLLMDPILNQPVHIIQEELLKEEITKEQLHVRYIPYHSLGQEQGLLPVVTLKAMYIKGTQENEAVSPVYLEKPVFGLAREKLFQSQNYQVILNAKGMPM